MNRILIAGGLVGLALLATPLSAQAPAPATPSAAPALPPELDRVSFPPPRRIEGQPIETRPPEKADDAPLFPEQTRAPYHATVPYKVTVLADKISAPWNLAILPDGKILVTERLPGTVRIVDRTGNLSAPLPGLEHLSAAKSMGLFDVVLDPAFARNRRIFIAYCEYDGVTNSNTYVAKARLNADASAISDVQTIFRSLPAWPTPRLGARSGGRIVFDKDGNLIVTIGDRSTQPPWDVAQKMDVHLGKVIRITQDGKPAPGNPFIGVAGVLPEIWASGTRAQEGLAIDPVSGKVWETENGQRGGDELNLIEKGKNYGWPVIAHGIDYPGGPITGGITAKDGLEQPVYYWDPVIAPSGMAFYTGNLFPQWRHSLLVGALRGKMLVRLEMSRDKVIAEEPLLTEVNERIRDVRVGPDGAVYVLTTSPTVTSHPPATARLLKITPG